MSLRLVILPLLCLLASDVARAAGPAITMPYDQPYRPQFHFTSIRDWLNDPNGLVYYDGEYHLFFQRTVGSTQGNADRMSWGHAVSKDLVHWEQLADAIKLDEDGSIWSGSAVVDWANTSGFGENGKPPLLAFYTRAKAPFDQCLAYSNDRGRTWTKYSGNPVVLHVNAKNRDPKVIWHAPSRQWIMALYLDRPSEFALYASENAIRWRMLHTVTLEGDNECPDFFPLAVDDDPKNTKWVFTAANGKYVVGSFDGYRFTPETDVLTSEHGPNFYAAQTYSGVPEKDGRRIQIGWMRDGKYPGMPFNQQMSFPCDLSLRTTSRGLRLFRNPVHTIESLYANSIKRQDMTVLPEQPFTVTTTSPLLDVIVQIDVSQAADCTIDLSGFPVTLHSDGNAVSMQAWNRRTTLAKHGGLQTLRFLVDRTSVEIFADDGMTVMSGYVDLVNARPEITVQPKAGPVAVNLLLINELQSAWPTAWPAKADGAKGH